ncbi:MAG: peptide ABC transporter substrate-binding protein, partial [Tabrizicola sp.]|nr:peptide ABC transporter substrate-binding protein [Tabrizicola sp.]
MKLRAALLGAVAALGISPAAFAERGTDGEVKLTFPQAVSIMNPYLSGGTKDIYASSMVLEPLAGLTPEGVLTPKLVTEIPTLENGGV